MSTKTVTATLLAALISVSGLAACGDTEGAPASTTGSGGGGNSQMQ